MTDARIDRYQGALLGVAVGDALGAPVEFKTAPQIKRRFGTLREMVGGGWLHVLPGEVTDDTQMTLAVAEGIAKGGRTLKGAYQAVGDNFLRWYWTKPKDVGNCCAAILREMTGVYNFGNETNIQRWHRAARTYHKISDGATAGNGALMRAVYPALYYERERAQKVAEAIAKMTHWHNHSTQTVLFYTDAINTIANSTMTAQEARETVEAQMKLVRAELEARESAKGMKGESEPKTVEPSGYCINSLICAANAIRDTNTFEDALVAAVNLGGDADTIGAITGGLAGAIYGASAIPLRWLNALNNEPNERTVKIFCQPDQIAKRPGNVLTIRLIDLAQEAYEHHEKTGY